MNTKRTVHIIGAGMAGLSAAVRAIELGHRVRVYEGATQAGGRCRSFHDATLDRVIDNGNHLILGGNHGIFAHLKSIGATDRLVPFAELRFPFLDLVTMQGWSVRPGRGRLPWWLLVPSRRVPGSRLGDYLAMLRLVEAPADKKLIDYVDRLAPIWTRFWEPLALAVLNTEAETCSARLIGRMLAETLMRGGEASRPYFAPVSLGHALVEPALDFLRPHDAAPRFACRLRGIDFAEDRAMRLTFADEDVDVAADDVVIVAVPSWEAGSLLPGLSMPSETRPIVNAHFRLTAPLALMDGAPIIGIIGGTSHWIFQRGDMISVTVSAATGLAEQSAERIAADIWSDIARAAGRPDLAMPPVRIIKERRATIAQTPQEDARRPTTKTRWRNVFLAGDWVQTGLPATIEGAVRSGRNAAEAVGHKG